MRLRLFCLIACILFMTRLFALCSSDVPANHHDQRHQWNPVIAALGMTCRNLGSQKSCLMLYYQNGTPICDWRRPKTATQSIPCNLDIQHAKSQFPKDFSMYFSIHSLHCASLKTKTACISYLNKQDKHLRCQWQ